MGEYPQETQEKPKEPKLNDINLKKTVLYHHLHNIDNLYWFSYAAYLYICT